MIDGAGGGTSPLVGGASRLIVTALVLFAVAAFSVLATLVHVGHISVSVGVSAVSTPVTSLSSADGSRGAQSYAHNSTRSMKPWMNERGWRSKERGKTKKGMEGMESRKAGRERRKQRRRREKVALGGDRTARSDRLQDINVSKVSVHTERSHPLPTTVYGHVHIARTGGSTVNRMLSKKYQRVCGNKGYSLPELTDKVDQARRARREKRKNDMDPKSKLKGLGKVMEEIGFQDCDYISHETGWEFWQALRGKVKVGRPIELHVPCRDPVDHLMSLCNFYDYSLLCEGSEKEFMSGVRKCLTSHRGVEARFSNQLLKSPTLTVKCMDFKKQFTDYMDLMGARLEKKAEQQHQIVIQKNSHGRENRTECIWQHPNLMKKARKFMLTNFDYFSFCHRCIESEADIMRAKEKEIKSQRHLDGGKGKVARA